jgi:hypothetical protein
MSACACVCVCVCLCFYDRSSARGIHTDDSMIEIEGRRADSSGSGGVSGIHFPVFVFPSFSRSFLSLFVLLLGLLLLLFILLLLLLRTSSKIREEIEASPDDDSTAHSKAISLNQHATSKENRTNSEKQLKPIATTAALQLQETRYPFVFDPFG